MLEKNENTAELVGLSFGDGGLTYRTGTKSLRFQLRGDFSEDREHYDTYVIDLFNKEVMLPLLDRRVGIVFNKNKGFYGISVQSNKINDLNEVLGIPIGIKGELSIPQWIKSEEKYIVGFLRGFLDTDGTVSCQRNYSIKNNKFHTQIRIQLSCCSKNLMKEIYELIKIMGFKCMLREEKRRAGWRNTHLVKIAGGIQVNKWFDLIGSKNPKHITKYLIWKEFGFCPPYTNLEQRKQILKKDLSPYSFYAGVPERSNGLERFQ